MKVLPTPEEALDFEQFQRDNRYKVNHLLNRVIWVCILSGPAIALGVLGGVFKQTTYLACFVLSCGMLLVAGSNYLILKRYPYSYTPSVFALIAVDVLLCYMNASHISVRLTWFVVPLLSLLLCDSRLYIEISLLNYFTMALGTWLEAEHYAAVRIDFSTPLLGFINIFTGCTIEALVMFAVGYALSKATNNYYRKIIGQYADVQCAREATDKANAAKSEFLANMSHEIRTPINAVLGMNEMILRESLEARDRIPADNAALGEQLHSISACAENIESAGNNLLAIINDVLDFSKIESGKMEITEANYQFSSVLNDVSNMVAFKARDKGLAFHVDSDPMLPEVLYGDEVRVRQVITNILNNAVKYTNEGSVTLSIKTDGGAPVREGETVRLVIAVTDTGIGIRQEDMQRLFQKFERVDLQRNSTVEGAGLGLAITSNLLEMMGGSVRVESKYGKGSVFTIILPQRVISAEPVGDFREKFEQSVREAKAYEGSFRAPDAHILIVDDTKMNLTVATGLLKKTEIRIDTAGSGAQAIELAQTIPYDLILMDQRMPEMGGTEAMQRIKALEGGANGKTPFISLTADAVSGARRRYLAEGFTDYLSKPIDSHALEMMLMKYLPQEKVFSVSPETEAAAEETPEPAGEDGFAPLRAAGIDPETGLRYCQRDPEFYRSMLGEYAQGAAEKCRDMERFFAAEDWKNYAILVHALKSTSKTIGATELSERALRLETAAENGDGQTIAAEHETMMTQYEAVTRTIGAVLSEAAAPSDDETLEFLPEDDGILEFLPGED